MGQQCSSISETNRLYEMPLTQYVANQRINSALSLWKNRYAPFQQLIECRMFVNSQKDLNKIYEIFKLRHMHLYLPATRYLTCDHQGIKGCGDYYKGNIYFQSSIATLSLINDIPFIDSLHLYSVAFKGFQILYRYFGFFQVFQDMFHVCDNGRIKVWCNAHIYKLFPESYVLDSRGTEEDMIYKIINIVDENTDKSQKLNFKQAIYSKIPKGTHYKSFQQINSIFRIICKQNNWQAPQRLKCISQLSRQDIQRMLYHVPKNALCANEDNIPIVPNTIKHLTTMNTLNHDSNNIHNTMNVLDQGKTSIRVQNMQNKQVSTNSMNKRIIYQRATKNDFHRLQNVNNQKVVDSKRYHQNITTPSINLIRDYQITPYFAVKPTALIRGYASSAQKQRQYSQNSIKIINNKIIDQRFSNPYQKSNIQPMMPISPLHKFSNNNNPANHYNNIYVNKQTKQKPVIEAKLFKNQRIQNITRQQINDNINDGGHQLPNNVPKADQKHLMNIPHFRFAVPKQMQYNSKGKSQQVNITQKVLQKQCNQDKSLISNNERYHINGGIIKQKYQDDHQYYRQKQKNKTMQLIKKFNETHSNNELDLRSTRNQKQKHNKIVKSIIIPDSSRLNRSKVIQTYNGKTNSTNVHTQLNQVSLNQQWQTQQKLINRHNNNKMIQNYEKKDLTIQKEMKNYKDFDYVDDKAAFVDSSHDTEYTDPKLFDLLAIDRQSIITSPIFNFTPKQQTQYQNNIFGNKKEHIQNNTTQNQLFYSFSEKKLQLKHHRDERNGNVSYFGQQQNIRAQTQIENKYAYKVSHDTQNSKKYQTKMDKEIWNDLQQLRKNKNIFH